MSTNFKESLKIFPTKEDEKRKYQIEAYKGFLYETLPGYIRFMEAINLTITELENKGIIGKTKLKTRLKAINSAINNTDEKALDDIFGFELITQNERDKEILMFIIHNLFVKEYIRQKNHNKSNGYFAHHCTGTINRIPQSLEKTDFEEHILEAETNELKEEYRDLSRQEQKKYRRNEIFTKKPRYPMLKREILEKGKLENRLQDGLHDALSFINSYINEKPDLRKNMPVFEMQFKTAEVGEKIKSGQAQHAKYKRVNEEDVKKRYFQRGLVRGVDFPFVFVRNNEGILEVEQTRKTLINMWPFLKDTIEEYERTQIHPIMNYDMYFAKIFPELENYIRRNLVNELSIPVENFSSENVWNIIKSKILRNDFVLPYYKQREQIRV